MNRTHLFMAKKKSAKQSSWAKLCSIFLGIIVISVLFAFCVVFVSDNNINNDNSIPSKRIKFTAAVNNTTIPVKSPVTVPYLERHSDVPISPDINENRGTNSDLYNFCPNIKRPKDISLLPHKKSNGSFDMHFIHVPKCGGTSMTAILREVACKMDSQRNVDCCTNPGFCDWHAFRRCSSIRGCINHIPQRTYIFRPLPSISMLRDPTSRIISAWFYRGHSPNLDFFQVRPEFKEISNGLRPRVTFDEYIEMPEYQNIQTRMFGADSFPYKNVTITHEVYCLAAEAIEHLFFVGIQEAYDISVKVLLREFNISINSPILKERDQNSGKISLQKKELKANSTLITKFQELNKFDYDLYNLGISKFCRSVRKYPDLLLSLSQTTKIKC